MPIMRVEITDTFGGQANYSWVNRFEEKVLGSDAFTDRQAVTLAKKKAGWTGLRCETENCGDMFILRPRNMCQVMFITFESEEPENAERTNQNLHKADLPQGKAA